VSLKIFDKLLTSSTELLDGLLPVLICAPPESPSEEPRKIYYHADGTNDNSKPTEVSDTRRTTRSAGAASSTSSKVPAKKSSSTQPQKRPEIHLFSSKSRITEDSDGAVRIRARTTRMQKDVIMLICLRTGNRASYGPTSQTQPNMSPQPPLPQSTNTATTRLLSCHHLIMVPNPAQKRGPCQMLTRLSK
jgi:hypothetical protein